MQKLQILIFASVFQEQTVEAIRQTHSELLSALEEDFELDMFFEKDIAEKQSHADAPLVVLVATGGTEGMMVRNYSSLPHPLTLLTDGKANSLAASLEMSCWIRQQRDTCEVLHGSMAAIKENLKQKALLYGARLGVIGKPSDWLVSSHVDYAKAHARWGVEILDYPLTRVEEYYAEAVADDAAVDALMSKAAAIREPNREEMVKAYRLYLALKRLATEEHLDALTLQCFSLIPTTCTTGCLALALLNDEGIVAGCEGDIPSMFTMLLVRKTTGKDGFMANPAVLDTEKRQITFAHCTIGLRQVNSYILRSHFESNSGVAIQGTLPLGKVAIVKYGGEDLCQHIRLTGTILENQDDERKCRTQILIQLDETSDINYFLTSSIGNHHVIYSLA